MYVVLDAHHFKKKSYGVLAGNISSQSMLFAKSGIELIILTIVSDKNQLQHSLTWILLIMMVGTAVLQVNIRIFGQTYVSHLCIFSCTIWTKDYNYVILSLCFLSHAASLMYHVYSMDLFIMINGIDLHGINLCLSWSECPWLSAVSSWFHGSSSWIHWQKRKWLRFMTNCYLKQIPDLMKRPSCCNQVTQDILDHYRIQLNRIPLPPFFIICK